MKTVHAITSGALILLLVANAHPQGLRVAGKILKVDYIEEQNSLVVTAVGAANYDNHNKAQLIRAVYANPPEDGIQDYFLMIVRVDGPGDGTTETSARNTWVAYKKEAPWLKGIRVHGGVVVKERLINKASGKDAKPREKIDIEVLGGELYKGEDKYYRIGRQDPALTLKEVEMIVLEKKGNIERVNIIRIQRISNDEAVRELDMMLKDQGIARKEFVEPKKK